MSFLRIETETKEGAKKRWREELRQGRMLTDMLSGPGLFVRAVAQEHARNAERGPIRKRKLVIGNRVRLHLPPARR